MNSLTLIPTVFYITLLSLFANSDARNWKIVGAPPLYAELVSVDESTRKVVLLVDDEKEIVKYIEQFSESDIAWIFEWLNIKDELTGTADDAPGKTEYTIHSETYDTDIFTYYPSGYNDSTAQNYPLMILFHPSGKARSYLFRHIEAAEETGFIVVSLGQFRNTGNDKIKEANFRTRFEEVFPHLRKEIVFNPEKVFMGGISGGAWRSYNYSAWIDYPWAGIYANGGWLGVHNERYALDYRDNMSIVMVNGNSDDAAAHWIKSDTNILSKHHCNISLISFEGGHQIAPTKHQIRAFKLLLNPE